MRQGFVAQHGLYQGSSGAAVAVGEGVDGLELCVRQSDLGQCRDIGSLGEVDQIGDCGSDQVMARPGRPCRGSHRTVS